MTTREETSRRINRLLALEQPLSLLHEDRPSRATRVVYAATFRTFDSLASDWFADKGFG